MPEQKLYTTTATTNHVRAPSVIAQKVYVPQITQASNVNYETRPAQTVNTVRTTQF